MVVNALWSPHVIGATRASQNAPWIARDRRYPAGSQPEAAATAAGPEDTSLSNSGGPNTMPIWGGRNGDTAIWSWPGNVSHGSLQNLGGSPAYAIALGTALGSSEYIVGWSDVTLPGGRSKRGFKISFNGQGSQIASTSVLDPPDDPNVSGDDAADFRFSCEGNCVNTSGIAAGAYLDSRFGRTRRVSWQSAIPNAIPVLNIQSQGLQLEQATIRGNNSPSTLLPDNLTVSVGMAFSLSGSVIRAFGQIDSGHV